MEYIVRVAYVGSVSAVLSFILSSVEWETSTPTVLFTLASISLVKLAIINANEIKLIATAHAWIYRKF